MDDIPYMLCERHSEQVPSRDTIECMNSTELVGTLNHVWKGTLCQGEGWLIQKFQRHKDEDMTEGLLKETFKIWAVDFLL